MPLLLLLLLPRFLTLSFTQSILLVSTSQYISINLAPAATKKNPDKT